MNYYHLFPTYDSARREFDKMKAQSLSDKVSLQHMRIDRGVNHYYFIVIPINIAIQDEKIWGLSGGKCDASALMDFLEEKKKYIEFRKMEIEYRLNYEPKMIFVRPRRDPVDGKGDIWEWLLSETNWNSLPDSEKCGVVIGLFELKGGELVMDIKWSNGHISKNVFPDEVSIVKRENKEESEL